MDLMIFCLASLCLNDQFVTLRAKANEKALSKIKHLVNLNRK